MPFTIYDYILQDSQATLENAGDAARGITWNEVDTREQDNLPLFTRHEFTINDIDVYYDTAADCFIFVAAPFNLKQLAQDIQTASDYLGIANRHYGLSSQVVANIKLTEAKNRFKEATGTMDDPAGYIQAITEVLEND